METKSTVKPSKEEENQLQPREWLVGLQTAFLSAPEQKGQVKALFKVKETLSHRNCPL